MKASGFFLLILFLILTFSSWGQTDVPEPQMNADPGGPPPPGLVVPIDTNSAILLVAGLFLGFYFLYLRRNSLSRK